MDLTGLPRDLEPHLCAMLDRLNKAGLLDKIEYGDYAGSYGRVVIWEDKATYQPIHWRWKNLPGDGS